MQRLPVPKEILEEKWNAYSHGFGIVLGVLGMLFLLDKQIGTRQFWPVLIYGVSVILLFSASTWYHSVQNPSLKRKLRVLDHISIYYLIAGTYTPVCLWILEGSRGFLLLCLVWGIAVFGTFLKLFFTGKFEVFSLLLYGVMGWLIVIDLGYLMENTSKTELLFLALGGAFYTIGILFYATKKIPFNHLIWHFFVLGGAISHWLMVCTIIE
ncbi:hemolysin III family protein [Muricauda sp. SCSIO 64092]|uniref:PAQR family membrane homeostasis protein TrhA n=1 Tax=Allomuricauda sp. SCSIO 64092 TaxID=2908842 RepID=UPI001FF10FCE|nr:hemolysin III family protein [Muricauda sp. SCSIO 64092]UOY06026.1 hemolysin III family protein [Muricauda sp. SCSIO 64092]